jgi:hypothetical protein
MPFLEIFVHRLSGFILCVLLIPIQIADAKTASLPDTLELSGDYIIPVTINGRSYRWEVEPDGGAARVVNADVAKELALKPSMIGGLHMIGPIRLKAASDSARIDYGGVIEKDRLFWFDREASMISDGAVHPTMLPYSSVRFVLGPKAANERETVMPLEGAGMFGIGGGYGKFAYGEIELQISFSLKRSETLMTAPVGVELAAGQGGAFSEQQRQALIRFGVERPVRQVRFSQPLLLFDRPLQTALVRVSDFGDASTIADENMVDQDEIVVTGKAKKKTRYSLTLGQEFLKGCSSLTYDMKAKLIRLSCQP